MRRTFFVSSSSTFQAYPPDGSERLSSISFLSPEEKNSSTWVESGLKTMKADWLPSTAFIPDTLFEHTDAILLHFAPLVAGRTDTAVFVPVAANPVSSSGDNHNLLRFHPCLIFPAMIYDSRIIEQDTIRYDPFCIQRTERKCVTLLGNDCKRIYGCIADNSFYHRSFW